MVNISGKIWTLPQKGSPSLPRSGIEGATRFHFALPRAAISLARENSERGRMNRMVCSTQWWTSFCRYAPVSIRSDTAMGILYHSLPIQMKKAHPPRRDLAVIIAAWLKFTSQWWSPPERKWIAFKQALKNAVEEVYPYNFIHKRVAANILVCCTL